MWDIIPTKHPTVVSPDNQPIPTFVTLSGIVPIHYYMITLLDGHVFSDCIEFQSI